MRRILKIVSMGLAVTLVLGSLGFYGWTRASRYPAFDSAAKLAATARAEQGWYVFEPDGEPLAGFIFYPGGLVDPAAYAPLMQKLSEGGVLAVIVPMPLDLAVFGINRANRVIAAFPDVKSWGIGGHSLGGAMACEYVAGSPRSVDALVLLASYPAESTDLSKLGLTAVSVYGTEDGVSGAAFTDSVARLPAGAALVEIAGGNHAQFGDYGPQKGDGQALVSREEQQVTTALAILGVLARLQ